MFPTMFLIGTVKKNKFLSEKYFFDPKVFKECSGYNFHYCLVSCDKYVSKYF